MFAKMRQTNFGLYLIGSLRTNVNEIWIENKCILQPVAHFTNMV